MPVCFHWLRPSSLPGRIHCDCLLIFWLNFEHIFSPDPTLGSLFVKLPVVPLNFTSQQHTEVASSANKRSRKVTSARTLAVIKNALITQKKTL